MLPRPARLPFLAMAVTACMLLQSSWSTAQEVRGLDSLESGEIDTVLIMNPAYESEIRRSLEDRGLKAAELGE